MLPIHPLAEIFPPMSEKALAELAEDIRQNGLRDPIVLLDGQVLDGRNRALACDRLGIEPLTRPWDGKGDALHYVISKNLHRRHLNESQRAMVADSVAKLKHGGDRGNQHTGAKRPIGPLPPTRTEAAKLLNVGERSVKRAHIVNEEGIPELKAAVTSGEVSVSAAADVAKMSKGRQQEIVAGGAKKIAAAAKNSRRRKAKHTATDDGPKETEHDRDLRLIRNIWDGVCISARHEFLRGITEDINQAFAQETNDYVGAAQKIA